MDTVYVYMFINHTPFLAAGPAKLWGATKQGADNLETPYGDTLQKNYAVTTFVDFLVFICIYIYI